MSRVKAENYIQVAGWMISEYHLKSNELLVYALIHGFSQDGKSTFKGSLTYIAEWLNASKQTVINTIKILEAQKLIQKQVIQKENGVLSCEYWTCRSRPVESKEAPSEPVKNIDYPQSKILTTPSQKIRPPQSKILTTPSQKIRPPLIDTATDMNFDTATASEIKALLRERYQISLSKEFYPVAAAVFSTKDISLEDYFQWFFCMAKEKRVKDVRSFAFKLLASSDMVEQYLCEHAEPQPKPVKKQICPACGEEIRGSSQECCNCHCQLGETKVEILDYHRKFAQLPKEKQEFFLKETDEILAQSQLSFSQKFEAMNVLRQRYGLPGSCA